MRALIKRISMLPVCFAEEPLDTSEQICPFARPVHDSELEAITGGILPGPGTITGRVRMCDPDCLG
jgi:hypothetical protein